MKKLLFISVTFLGITFSVAQAGTSEFLQKIQEKLFKGERITVEEEAVLLKISPEAINTSRTIETSTIDNNTDKKRKQIRRHYQHLQILKKRDLFYAKNIVRIPGEASINIVRRKNKAAHQKLLRYRTAFPAYSR